MTLEGVGGGSSRVFSEDRVREEQMRVLFRTAPVGLNAALVGAFVLCGVLLYLDAQTPAVLARWMALVIADFACAKASARRSAGSSRRRFAGAPRPPSSPLRLSSADWCGASAASS